MQCRVIILESDKEFAVSRPLLKGCHSQGATKQETIENIRFAISKGREKSRRNLIRRLIVREALLPNVPPENVAALAETALKTT